MSVPILINHDANAAIGFMRMDGSSLVVTLKDDCTLFPDINDVYNVFGNVGMRVLKMNGAYITEFEILEFSYSMAGSAEPRSAV